MTDIGKAEPYFGVAIISLLGFGFLKKWSRRGDARYVDRWARLQKLAAFGLCSLLVSGFLTQGLKHVFGRKRPYADTTLSSHEFHPFTANYEFHSLPSGHAQVLFTVAAILAFIFPRARWYCLLLAGLFASTRVITLNHWVSDVVMGAAVGLCGTVLTLRVLKMRWVKKEITSRVSSLMIFLTGFLIAAGASLPSSARAESPGPLGFGLIIGDPTGLSGNYRLSAQRSIDGALAWSFGSLSGFKIHSDYLWHRPNLFRVEKAQFDLHYGIGARLLSISDAHSKDRTRFGPRLPVGLSTDFNQKALEVFAELALIMNIIPATSADFDFGIGARIYF